MDHSDGYLALRESRTRYEGTDLGGLNGPESFLPAGVSHCAGGWNPALSASVKLDHEAPSVMTEVQWPPQLNLCPQRSHSYQTWAP